MRPRVDEQAHVLGHQPGVEPGVVRAGHDPVRELVGGRRVAPGRHVEHVEDDAHVEPFRDPEGDRLRRCGQRRRRQVVVQQLHRLALSGACPDVEHVAGDRLEDRAVAPRGRSAGPANIIEIVAARAPATPPETGPSVYVTPSSASRAATSPATCGPTVERSTTVVTRRSCGGDELIDDRARGRAVGHAEQHGVGACEHVGRGWRPRSRRPGDVPPCRRRRSRSSSKPAAAMLVAIGRPMLPRPTKPTIVIGRVLGRG